MGKSLHDVVTYQPQARKQKNTNTCPATPEKYGLPVVNCPQDVFADPHQHSLSAESSAVSRQVRLIEVVLIEMM